MPNAQQTIYAKLILQHSKQNKKPVPKKVIGLLKAVENDVLVLLNNGKSLDFILKKAGDIVTENFDTYVKEMIALAQKEASQAVSVVKTVISAEVGSAVLSTPIVSEDLIGSSLFGKSTFSEFLESQAGFFVKQLKTQIKQAKAEGLSVPQTMKALSSQTGFAAMNKHHLLALTRSGLNSASNSALLDFYEENSDIISTLVFINTLDRRTSLICIGYTGCSWDVRTKKPITGGKPFAQPALHIRCRSIIGPGYSQEFNSQLPPARRAAKINGKTAYVSEAVDFDGWFKTQTKEEQIAQLGSKALYEKYKAGTPLNKLL